MSEAGWTEVTKLSGSDPRRVVSILRGTHGLFRFDALRWRKYYEPSADIPRLFPIPHLEPACAKDLKDRPKWSVVKRYIVERKSLIKEREPMV